MDTLKGFWHDKQAMHLMARGFGFRQMRFFFRASRSSFPKFPFSLKCLYVLVRLVVLLRGIEWRKSEMKYTAYLLSHLPHYSLL